MKRFFVFMIFIFLVNASLLMAETGGWSLQSLLVKQAAEKVKISGEFRYRLEYRDNFDFNDAKDDQDVFHLFRTRLNLGFEPCAFLRGFAQFQDARIVSSQFSNNKPFRDPVDLRQAYVEMYDPAQKGFGTRVGRQELGYGAERLVGTFNWSNVAQSFDAAKVFYQFETARIDAFAARKVLIEPSRTFNAWDDEDNFLGFYGTCQAVKNHTLDLYYFYRDTDRPIVFGPSVGSKDMKESTVGGRIAGKPLFGVDYQVEGAYQFGDFGNDDVSAWMFIGLVGYNFDWTWSPRLGFEFDHASGDKRSADGERNTFDNLFPTNHLFYGYMDLASLQNITDYIVSASVKPLTRLTLKLDGHFFFLDETTDSLYSAARIPTRTARTSGVSDQVGEEIDFTLNYQFCQQASGLLGYSHFFAGDFLSDTGSSDDGDFFYLQLITAF